MAAFKLESFKTQLMTMGGAIGIGALASSVGAHPLALAGHGMEAGAALSAFAGILAAYGQAAHFDAIKNKLGDPNEVLHNGDLVRLVGETIKMRLLAEKTTPANATHGKIIDALANAAPAFWKATATADAIPNDYADLTEGRLVSFFSRIDDLTAEQTALDAGRWRNFLVELANDAGITGLNGVEINIAEALHRHFPHDLRELLKHAYATGDKTYAAMQFRLFDSLRGGVGDLSAKLDTVVAVLQGQTGKLDTLATGQAELKELIEKLQAQLSVKDRQIDGLIGTLSTLRTNTQAAPTVTPQAQVIADLLPDTGDAFNRALKAIAENRFDDARQLLDSIIAEEEGALALLQRETEAAIERMVQRYVARGETEYYDLKYSAAAEWYQKASNLRPGDPMLLMGVGVVYANAKNYSIATQYLEKSLEINEKTLGHTHIITALNIGNLAEVYKLEGLFEKAESFYKRAVVSCGEVPSGMNLTLKLLYTNHVVAHPHTAKILHGLADLYQSQGLFSKAIPLYIRAIEIQKQQSREEHAEMLKSMKQLAECYSSQSLYLKSEELYREILTINEQFSGTLHTDTAISFYDVAESQFMQGMHDLSEYYFERALAIFEQVLGVNHPFTAKPMFFLGVIKYSQGQNIESEVLLRKCLEIRKSDLGLEHPATKATIEWLFLVQELNKIIP